MVVNYPFFRRWSVRNPSCATCRTDRDRPRPTCDRGVSSSRAARTTSTFCTCLCAPWPLQRSRGDGEDTDPRRALTIDAAAEVDRTPRVPSTFPSRRAKRRAFSYRILITNNTLILYFISVFAITKVTARETCTNASTRIKSLRVVCTCIYRVYLKHMCTEDRGVCIYIPPLRYNQAVYTHRSAVVCG